MPILKMILGFVVTLIAMAIAVKIVALILGVFGFLVNLLWVAFIIAVMCLVGWVVYKIVSPGHVHQE